MTTLKTEKWVRNVLIAALLIFTSGCGMNLPRASTPVEPVPSPVSTRVDLPSPTGIAAVSRPTAEPTLVPTWTHSPTPTPLLLDPQRWEHFYSPAEGPWTRFSDIAEAPDGTMWFLGSSGIYRYDLKTWTIYQPENIPAFQGKMADSVAAAPDGTIWVGTDRNEIVSFDGTTWVSQTVEEGDYRSLWVLSIVIRGNGELCAFSMEGMSCQNKGKWTRHRFEVPEDKAIPGDPVLTTQDEIWVSLSTGWLYFYDGSTWESYQISDGMGPVAASHDGSLWILTNLNSGGGLGKRSRSGEIAYLDIPPALVVAQPISLYELKDGTLWLGTWYGSVGGGLGLVIYQENGIFTTVDGRLLKKGQDYDLYYGQYPFGNVDEIFQSKTGAVWLAALNGLFRYTPDK